MTQDHSDCAGPTVARGKKRLKIAIGGLCAIAVCVAARYYWGGESCMPIRPVMTTDSAGQRPILRHPIPHRPAPPVQRRPCRVPILRSKAAN